MKEDSKIEAKRSRGTLLPIDEPVVEDIPIGMATNNRNHTDKNRYNLHYMLILFTLFLKNVCPVYTFSVKKCLSTIVKLEVL